MNQNGKKKEDQITENEDKILEFVKNKGAQWNGTTAVNIEGVDMEYRADGKAPIVKKTTDISVSIGKYGRIQVNIDLEPQSYFVEFHAEFQEFDYQNSKLTIKGHGNGIKPNYEITLQ